MHFRIHFGAGLYPADLEQHVRTRLFFALERFASRITDLVVRLDDVNGPRGGRDIRCRIDVRLRGTRKLQVESRAGDAAEAVDRAAGRAKRTVSRVVERMTDHATWRAAS